MDTQDRLKRLEDRLVHLEAIVDGSEAQTREATTYVISIVARYLHEKGLIDGVALRNYVSTFDGEESDREDYMGELVRQLGSMLDFQERHPTEFQLTPARTGDA